MSFTQEIENDQHERRFARRVWLACVLVVVAFAVIGWRASALQIDGYEHFRTLSENNRLRVEPLPPTRGLIYDRNGILLAENRPTYQLELVVEQVEDLTATLEVLGQIVGLSEQELERFRIARQNRRPFQPVLLKAALTDEQVAQVAVMRHEMPGVDITGRPVRHYPLGADLAHVVGYVGRITEDDLRRLDMRNYTGSAHTGKTGIERSYEARLHGAVGHRQVEVNAQGRVIREVSVTPPVRGEDLHLTIDARLQQRIREIFSGYDGVAIVTEVRTGEVLGLVSKPGFDPNLFVHGISRAQFADLQADPHNPLFNRALSGQYPPGSTLKPVMGLIGMDSGFTTAERRFFAAGYFQLPGHERRYRDWRRSGHGWVDLKRAIAVSSDVYFYDLAHRMGIDTMASYLARFGLGTPTGIDLPGERRGILPSREWKRATHDQVWFPGETLITIIGQGYMLVTPLQLADVTTTLANRGQRRQLHLLARASHGEKPAMPVVVPRHEPVGFTPAAWDAIGDAMVEVVHARHGTAWTSVGSHDIGYSLAGKTGTSQVFGLGEDETYDQDNLRRELWDHALFVGYAPAEAPEITVTVLVEHGGSGGRIAAPIARQIVDAWRELRDADSADLRQASVTTPISIRRDAP